MEDSEHENSESVWDVTVWFDSVPYGLFLIQIADRSSMIFHFQQNQDRSSVSLAPVVWKVHPYAKYFLCEYPYDGSITWNGEWRGRNRP